MSTAQYLLDIESFTRLGGSESGVVEIKSFQRVTADLPLQEGQQLSWSVQGELDSVERRFLHLQAKGSIILECQRCLKPYVQAIDIRNTFEAVNTEAELELDEEDFEGSDRILSTQRFNLLELIEDEVILSLPFVASHEICPSLPDILLGNDDSNLDAEKPNPFAVLSGLKKT